MSGGLIRPPADGEFGDDDLEDQMKRWARLNSWNEAGWYAEELLARQPDNSERIRAAAETNARMGNFTRCAALSARLRDTGTFSDSDSVLWLQALHHTNAKTQYLRELERLHQRANSFDALDYVSQVWWERFHGTGEPAERRELLSKAWDAALRAVPCARSEDDQSTVLNRLWGWRSLTRSDMTADMTGRLLAATRGLAASGSDAIRRRAAYFMADEQPQWTLDQLKDDDLTENVVVEARLQAHLVRQEYEEAARDCEHLKKIWGSLRDLPAEGFIRYQWVRTLLDLGRLDEMETECRAVMVELAQTEGQLLAQLHPEPGPQREPSRAEGAKEHVQRIGPSLDPEVDRAAEKTTPPPEKLPVHDPNYLSASARFVQVRRLRCFYSIDLGRLCYLKGRFDEAWRLYRQAVALDDERLDESTRGALAYVGLIAAPNASTAANHLAVLESRWDINTSVVTKQPNTALLEACLWVAARWESADGTWCPKEWLGVTSEQETLLRHARARGLSIAREMLARIETGSDVSQHVRLALLAGDELQAEALARQLSASETSRWEGRVLRAVLQLQLGKDYDALKLLRSVMAERRFDVDLRVLYAHAALLAGELEEAHQEAFEIVEMAPDHTMARVVRAECAFEWALRPPGSSSHQPVAEQGQGSTESVAMENVQELLAAVSDYHHAVVLDSRTKDFLDADAEMPTAGPLGSDLLTPRQVVQVCRRGLHAAIIAQEGLDRLRLKRDDALESRARDLLRCMRALDPEHPCPQCREPATKAGSRHGRKHRRQLDEAARLEHLLTGSQRARGKRLLATWGVVLLGLVVAAAATFGLLGLDNGISKHVTVQASVRTTILAFGLLIATLPFVRSIKFANFEVNRGEEVAQLSGRSKALRTSSVFQRNAILSTTASILPSMTART